MPCQMFLFCALAAAKTVEAAHMVCPRVDQAVPISVLARAAPGRRADAGRRAVSSGVSVLYLPVFRTCLRACAGSALPTLGPLRSTGAAVGMLTEHLPSAAGD